MGCERKSRQRGMKIMPRLFIYLTSLHSPGLRLCNVNLGLSLDPLNHPQSYDDSMLPSRCSILENNGRSNKLYQYVVGIDNQAAS